MAEIDGRVVGHVAFSPVVISDGTKDWYGLGPVSVLPEYQKQCIGKSLIDTLNSLLADELTAINQYMLHSEMCANWGYGKLHEHFEKRAIVEMKHAEKLIGRILFLEGKPTVSKLNPIRIGSDIPKQFEYDHAAEESAIKTYNSAIKLAGDVDDFAAREMLERIL